MPPCDILWASLLNSYYPLTHVGLHLKVSEVIPWI